MTPHFFLNWARKCLLMHLYLISLLRLFLIVAIFIAQVCKKISTCFKSIKARLQRIRTVLTNWFISTKQKQNGTHISRDCLLEFLFAFISNERQIFSNQVNHLTFGTSFGYKQKMREFNFNNDFLVRKSKPCHYTWQNPTQFIKIAFKLGLQGLILSTKLFGFAKSVVLNLRR